MGLVGYILWPLLSGMVDLGTLTFIDVLYMEHYDTAALVRLGIDDIWVL